MTGLPMFSESSRASSSRWAMISSARRSSTFLRSPGAMRGHGPCSKALRALATARSTSAWPQAVTWASTLLVAGLMAAKVAPSCALTGLPSISALAGR
ncbi:hypothetical protein D3C79_732410 [compost metagenome]